MLKELSKVIKDFDVQINVEHHEEGMKAKLIFIPKEKGEAILPIKSWGDAQTVENYIRFELSEKIADNPDEQDPVEIKEPDTEQPEICEPEIEEAKVIDIEKERTKKAIEKIVEESGAPKDNIIVGTPGPISPQDQKKIKDTFEAHHQLPKEEVEESLEPIKKVERCEKCEIPKDSMGDNECVYEDCPEGKQMDKYKPKADTAPEDADNYMVEEELRKRVKQTPIPTPIDPEDAFGGVPEWAETEIESREQARQNNSNAVNDNNDDNVAEDENQITLF